CALSYLSSIILVSHLAPPTTPTYTLSLHDALPISEGETRRPPDTETEAHARQPRQADAGPSAERYLTPRATTPPAAQSPCLPLRSEEHTSELQSRENLVCRLLLEKKKKQPQLQIHE